MLFGQRSADRSVGLAIMCLVNALYFLQRGRILASTIGVGSLWDWLGRFIAARAAISLGRALW